MTPANTSTSRLLAHAAVALASLATTVHAVQPLHSGTIAAPKTTPSAAPPVAPAAARAALPGSVPATLPPPSSLPGRAPLALGAVPAPTVKPPGGQRAHAASGTQTEDDIYVGIRRQVQGVNAPGTATPQVRPGAGTSPHVASTTGRKTARGGGDDELDELEVERRKVQGVNMPGATAPQVRPGAGTSPNTGRSAAPLRLP